MQIFSTKMKKDQQTNKALLVNEIHGADGLADIKNINISTSALPAWKN